MDDFFLKNEDSLRKYVMNIMIQVVALIFFYPQSHRREDEAYMHLSRK